MKFEKYSAKCPLKIGFCKGYLCKIEKMLVYRVKVLKKNKRVI